MDSDRRSMIVRSVFYAVLVIAMILIAYLAVTGFTSLRALTAAKTNMASAQRVVATDPTRAQELAGEAQESAKEAAGTLNNPVWSVIGAVPYFGATPRTAAAISQSLDEAIVAVEPALQTLNTLNPSTLVKDGQIDITPLQQAIPTAEAALPGVERAQQTLAEAPQEGLLIGPVEDAQTQLTEQLNTIHGTLATAVNFGRVAGPLLGQDGQRRYFLALLNPNESRGTGGFLGNYAILTATNGSLQVSDIGGNADIPNLTQFPDGVSDEFRARYGTDPLLRGNMNLSPHFPDTAKMWLEAWRQKTGEQLDGALAIDVVALGQLVNASGRTVRLPNGSTLNGTQLTQFALKDVYEQIPDTPTRDAFQIAVATSALRTVTALPKPLPMARAFGEGLTQNRIVAWAADDNVEKDLAKAGISGTIAVAGGHNVKVVLLNSNGSKLDAWLSREVAYNVGQCSTEGQVASSVEVDVRSDVPLGKRPPRYMIGSAQEGTNGPINSTFVQVYLPEGALITSVTLDGVEAGRLTFTEQGRQAVLVALDLPPRITHRVEVAFTEPAGDAPAEVAVQPLAREQATTVRDAECS